MRNNSNMVLVDVKMLSGFTTVMSSIEEVNTRNPRNPIEKTIVYKCNNWLAKPSYGILHLN